MSKTILYGCILIGVFLVRSLNSWGSTSLPQLSIGHEMSASIYLLQDTIPAKKPTGEQQQPAQPTVSETVVEPVVKQVPKSRKKLKPAAVTPKVKAIPGKIIKPKVVIKKIKVTIP